MGNKTGWGIPTADMALITVSPDVGTKSVVIIHANSERRGFLLYNSSNKDVYVSYSEVSSVMACSLIIPANSNYSANEPVCYTGVISAIRSVGSGAVVITELS